MTGWYQATQMFRESEFTSMEEKSRTNKLPVRTRDRGRL